jgi:hypothetical protein
VTRSPRACSATATGDEWADIIDTLTMYPEQHEHFMRVLGQIDGEGD